MKRLVEVFGVGVACSDPNPASAEIAEAIRYVLQHRISLSKAARDGAELFLWDSQDHVFQDIKGLLANGTLG